MKPKIAYKLLGLPVEYHDLSWADTKVPASKAELMESKLAKAPASGVLLVSGSAAPVVNYFMERRKVVGLNFPEYFESKLSNEETLETPKGAVIVIYGVGSEPANNTTFSGKVLGALLSTYKSCLVILQTDKTLSNFQTSYGLSIVNHFNIPEKDVEKWA